MNRTSPATSYFRILMLCFGMLLGGLLSACGGGGGKVGLPTGVALFTNAPAGLSLAAGATGSYAIGGGNPTYSVSTSNKDVVTATVSGTSLTITAVGAGAATISVTDAVGASVQVPVTVSGPVAPPVIPPGSLFTTAAGSITLAVGANATYGIGGGKPAYAVSSSNTGVATATLSGSNFTVTGIAAGSADVVVTDAAGTALTVSVKVGSGTTVALFTTAPNTVVIGVGAVGGYTVGGGKPAYAVSSSNAAVASVTLTGNNFTITGASAGTAQVVVVDADGNTLEIAVTIGSAGAATDLFTTAPGDITIATGATASYTIGGGKPAYSVSSSNAAVARVAINGSGFIITGMSSGTAQVFVFDASGHSVNMSVTVGAGSSSTALYTTAPGSLTLGIGVTETYAIGGGKPAYAVSSSNSGVVKVTVNGTDFTVTGVAAGTAQIAISDTTGSALTLAVTVGTPATPIALFTTAPSSVTVPVGFVVTFAVGGGKAPYAATSSDSVVVRTGVTGTDFVIAGFAIGTAQVVVSDSTGATVAIAVTVNSGSGTPVAQLYTTAPSPVTLAPGAVGSYTVGGGAPGYTANSSDTSVAAVSLSGTALTITAGSAGTARVSIFDSLGALVTVDVTVSQAPVLAVAVAPGSATGNVGDSLVFVVSGGAPGYTVTMNNASIATVAPASVPTNGGSFTISLVNVGTTVATIVDARGQTVSLPITVNQTSTVLRLSPSALMVAENSVNQIDLNIFGGTGPYRAFTSDQTLSSVAISGTTLSVSVGSNGNRCINPITSDGTYVPNGTFDVTITAVDSLGASATSILTIKDNGAGLSAGCPP